MIVQAHFIDGDLDSLLRNRVGQALYDFIASLTTEKKSLMAAVNSTNIEIPIIYSDDLYLEQVFDIAKTVEVKLAYDIKKFLEMDIKSNACDANYARLIKELPVTILDRGQNVSSGVSQLFEKMGIEVNVTDSTGRTYSEAMLQERIGKSALKYAKGYTRGSKLYGEANSPMIQERNALPTNIEVEIKYTTEKGEIKTVKYMMSVQCIPKKVDLNELSERIGLYDTKNFYKKLVMLERGQISFLADMMLDFKILSNRAKANSQGAKNIFNVIDKLNLMQEAGINIYPFTVFILSQGLIDKVMKDHGIDVTNRSEAHRIMKKFFAMGITIYHPETDLVDVIYDGDTDYTTHQYGDFGKDVAKYERELKQLIKFNK